MILKIKMKEKKEINKYIDECNKRAKKIKKKKEERKKRENKKKQGQLRSATLRYPMRPCMFKVKLL